MTHSFNLMN